jgi:hypothetical protein
MELGLFPKISTPVEKPVENTGFAVVCTIFTLILRRYFEAKVHRARFEALLRAPHQILRRTDAQA